MPISEQELKNFPVQVLLDLARNESAQRATRFACVEELLDRDDRRALHPDLAGIVADILHAREGAVEAKKEAVQVLKKAAEEHRDEPDI